MGTNNIVVVRGAGDLATGVIYRLYKLGFKVVALEILKPSVIRRTVALASAVYQGVMQVEDLVGVLCHDISEVLGVWREDKIPILIDPDGKSIAQLKPAIVVDAILAKKNLGTNKNMAPIVIGLGPGFIAPLDVDAVIETNRGHFLGRVITTGKAQENTGEPGKIVGFGKERVLKSPVRGLVRIRKDIGEMVEKGEVLAEVQGVPVVATISGVVRGMIYEGYRVAKGMKMGDIDPRGHQEYCYFISDKALSLAGGVVQAVFMIARKKGIEFDEKAFNDCLSRKY